jgi:hypothetical protein
MIEVRDGVLLLSYTAALSLPIDMGLHDRLPPVH